MTSGKIQSSYLRSAYSHLSGNVISIPVEDPVLDTTVVIAGFIPRRGGRVNHFGLPVLFDKILQVFAIRRSRIWDVMVGEPALELSLVPFVVD